MRAALLVNPRAHRLLADPGLPDRLEAAIRAATGWEVLRPEGESLDAVLDAAEAAGAQVVIACGGDGTVRHVGARLADSGRLLAVLPLGTLNLFARDLGMPVDPEAAAAALGTAQPRAVDVAEVNGEAFLCQSVIGVPNLLGRHREAVRGSTRLVDLRRLVVAGWRAFGQQRPIRLALLLPGAARPRRFWTRALSVANNDYADAPGRMFARDTLDGGILAVHVARRFDLRWTLHMLFAMALGRWKRDPEIEILRGPSLEVLSRRRSLRVMNDGEALLLETPLRYRIRPRALQVLAPASA